MANNAVMNPALGTLGRFSCEIRLQIYREVLENMRHSSFSIFDEPGLLRTSLQINREAGSFFYGCHDLHIRVDDDQSLRRAVRWITKIGNGNASLLKRARVRFTFRGEPHRFIYNVNLSEKNGGNWRLLLKPERVDYFDLHRKSRATETRRELEKMLDIAVPRSGGKLSAKQWIHLFRAVHYYKGLID